MTTMQPADLESLLHATQPAFHVAGEEQGIWSMLTCTCGRPDCEIGNPARFTVTLQLDSLAAHWRPERASQPVTNDMMAALQRLADVLNLPTEIDAKAGQPRALLHAVRDQWLASMGTPLGGPDEQWMRDLQRVEARNSLLLDVLLAALVALPFSRIADAGAVHARLRRGRATREGATACQMALLKWIPDQTTLPQRTLLQEHLLALLAEAEWSAGEAQDVMRMAEDAAHAVLAYGIAGETWVRAAYGGMDRIVPLSSIRVALVLGDDPVPLLPR